MKIAVWHNLPSGGGKRALYYHVRGLVERGHVVEAWCPPTADRSFLPLSELIPEHTVPLDSEPSARRHMIGRYTAPYRDIVDSLEAMDRHCRACADQINGGGYDILFANACQFFRVTSIGRHVRLPKAIYLGEPYRWLYEALPELPWLALPADSRQPWSLRYLRRFISNLIRVQGYRVQAREELLSARSFDAILTNSLFSRESMLRTYGLAAKVCYLGIDTSLFFNRHRARENVVVGLGAIIPEKRLDVVITAIGFLPQPRPDLVWIGNMAVSSHLEKMQQLARELGVRLRVKVAVKDDDLVDTLSRAAVFAYAPRLEPFGLAPLEANAMGLPVVAVAEGGVRESVIHGVTGLLVEDDPQAIARAIGRLLEDQAYAAQLGAAGCALVSERWSLASSIERLEEALSEVLGRHRIDRPR